MKYPSFINARNIFFIVGLFVIFLLLYFRLNKGLFRAFGPDEFGHLHFAYLLSIGSVPFYDVFYIYSPFFHYTILPIFLILGDSFQVLLISRVFMFIYFLLYVFFVFLITRKINNTYTAIIASVVATSVPLAVEKSIEVRPDNFMISLLFGGIYFFLRALDNDSKKWFFLSGLLFSFTSLVMIKIAVAIVGFLIGFVIYGLFIKQARHTFFRYGNFFVLGLFIPLILSVLISIPKGVLPEAVLWIFIFSKDLVSNFRFGTELTPLYWFLRNDSVYGTYLGPAWNANIILFLMAILGIFTTSIAVFRDKKKEFSLRLILLLPALLSFVYLFFVVRPFQQYLLPLCAFIPFWAAFFVADVSTFLAKFRRQLYYILPISLFILFFVSVESLVRGLQLGGNEQDRAFIEYTLAHTAPSDVFWGDPIYVFRPDGYVTFMANNAEYPKSMIDHLPPFIPTLEMRHTKYVLVHSPAVREQTWPFDQPQMEEFRLWILNNFIESQQPNLWVRKDRV